MRDPYEVLGVSRRASDEDIKAAYRDLAKRYHPDTAGGAPGAEDAFRDVNAAYSILKDKASRRSYDRGDIDASGAPKRRTYRSQNPYEGATAAQGASDASANGDSGFRFAFGDGEGATKVFQDLFGRKTKRSGKRGEDVTYRLKIDLSEAVKGGKRRVRLSTGSRLDVAIPAGVEDGQQIRLKGQGKPGKGGADGDALITISIKPHKSFMREGHDIFLELPVSVDEAVLGAKIAVPTLWGRVNMTIPKGSNTGTILRLKGKGVPKDKADSERGDQFVELQVILPEGDEAFARAVARWGGSGGEALRDDLEG